MVLIIRTEAIFKYCDFLAIRLGLPLVRSIPVMLNENLIMKCIEIQ